MTHARRYVVSSQLWLTIVSCRVTSSLLRNKTWPCANFQKSGQDASYGGVSCSHYRRLEATCHSHVCSPHFVSLHFINDVEYYGLRKETSHQQDCCPNHFPIKTHKSRINNRQKRRIQQTLRAEWQRYSRNGEIWQHWFLTRKFQQNVGLLGHQRN